MINRIKNFNNRTKLFFGSLYKRFYILMFILIINGILEGLSLASIPILLASLFRFENEEYFTNLSFLNFDFSLINPVLVFGSAVIIIFFIKNLFLFSVILFENYTYLKLKKNISSKIFNKIITKDFINYSKRNNSETIRILSNDIFQAVEYYRVIIIIIRETLTLIAIAILLIFASSVYGVLTFFILGLIAFLFARNVKNILTNNSKNILHLRSKIIEKIQNSLRGLKEIKIFSLEKIIYQNFIEDFSVAEKKVLINDIIFRSPKIFLEVLAIFFLVGSLVFLSFKSNIVEIIPILTLLAAAIVRFVPSYTSLTSGFSKIRHMQPGYQNILNQLENNHQTTQDFDTKENVNINYKNNFSKLIFEDVNFSYEKQKLILKNINITIKNNSTYFIKGKSGKGKSTLCYLILRLLDPDQGNILFDNKILNKEETKKLFSYVPQECLIINDTIENNIIFNQKINDTKYFNMICKEMGINELFEIHKDSILGDGGDLLSGGQKQRIAIARSLIRQPKILILDESFNALHEDAEMTLIKNIQKLCPDITLIIISHRSSVSKYSDEIIEVLDDGSVKIFENIKI